MSASSCFGTPLRVGSHPTTVALLMVMVTLAGASALGARQALCLIWNHTFMTQFYFWNVLTGSLLETHPMKLVLSLAGVLGMGPAVEESLGHVGMAVFLVVVSLASGLVTSTGIFVAYIVTRLEYLLDLEIHGTFGLMAALAVAAAQHDPKSSFLANGRAPWFPMRYFPLVLVTASATARALSLPMVSQDFPFVIVGAYSAWVYLRFFAHIVLGGPSGDISDEFRLAMFFPPVLHCVVKPMGDFTYGVFLLLGFFEGREARVPPSAVDGHGGVDPSTVAILPPPEPDGVWRMNGLMRYGKGRPNPSRETICSGANRDKRKDMFSLFSQSPRRWFSWDVTSRISAQSHELVCIVPTSGERLIRGYTKFGFTVDEGKGWLNPSREKN